MNVYQIMGNARAKAASRLDEILVDEQQNSAVFRDLAKDAAQGDRSVHTPFAGRMRAQVGGWQLRLTQVGVECAQDAAAAAAAVARGLGCAAARG